ncbi:2-phosphosulfolactate phosphatase [Agromyces silvae]|uniref:2-phosphosulfolactate phosphatase n=1 Tax=Agromyces silvae TaxID=3388266 RepID=UPI00280BE05D|nr:2-phosphosulfolactate phosphatase [Agromyces protaetiae]
MTTYPPASQGKYQIRFDQGDAGLARIAGGVDIVVWVDALADASAASRALPSSVVPDSAAIVAAGLTDASAVAAWILAEQERIGRRAYVAIVAASDGTSFAVPDVLAAGAVVDALMTLGIDDTSPEAAVVSAAFGGLKRAVRHLTAASAQGRQALADGVSPERLHALSAIDSTDEVRVLRAAH